MHDSDPTVPPGATFPRIDAVFKRAGTFVHKLTPEFFKR